MGTTLDKILAAVTSIADRANVTITIKIGSDPELEQSPIAQSAGAPPAHDTSESWRLLESAGVNNDKLVELAAKYSPRRIEECLVGVNGQAGVNSKGGYLIRALERNYYRKPKPKKKEQRK